MAAKVGYSNDAKADLLELAAFYYRAVGQQRAIEIITEIKQQAIYLANTPMLGTIKPATADHGEYREWYYKRRQLKFYFQRRGAKSIYVFRIWGASRKPLEPYEINP